ncbi:MAG: hypothetical protein DWQ01_15330 [Planctomycetota bacterium]|nr:MAG: hypothetical protein DWQ01_15330 [Planctomycetota bacterium]
MSEGLSTPRSDLPLPSRRQLLRSLEGYRQRQSRRMPPAEILLEDCLGAFWLELAHCPDPNQQWKQALRRVLYREWEQPHRRSLRGLYSEMPTVEENPQNTAELGEIIDRLPQIRTIETANGRLKPAAADLGCSRQNTRVHLTTLYRALSGDEAFHDLERRAARLFARATQEGPTPKVILEARRLRKLCRLLELPARLQNLWLSLNSLAGGKDPDHQENQDSASG